MLFFLLNNTPNTVAFCRPGVRERGVCRGEGGMLAEFDPPGDLKVALIVVEPGAIIRSPITPFIKNTGYLLDTMCVI
jgi:hypothetical protein